MVDRRRLARLKAAAHRDGIFVELEGGGAEVFPKSASLEFTVACWAEGMAEEKGEEYAWDPELRRLKEALENATPESRDDFYNKYAIVWENTTNEGAEEE